MYDLYASYDLVEKNFKLVNVMTEVARMNYYFTGLLIVMLVTLALCGGPSVQ